MVNMVRLPDGRWKDVKSFDWIRRRLYLVERAEANDSMGINPVCRVKLWLSDGRLYVRDWAKREDAWEWLTTRKALKDCPLMWYGQDLTITGGKLERPA